MGHIVFWTIIRLAVLIPVMWYLLETIRYRYWIIWVFIAVYIFVIHPAIISYKKFAEKSKPIIDNTLCSSCKHFDKTAVLCMLYDKHVSEEEIPCGGSAWEPD